jgi:hypothetical protein
MAENLAFGYFLIGHSFNFQLYEQLQNMLLCTYFNLQEQF